MQGRWGLQPLLLLLLPAPPFQLVGDLALSQGPGSQLRRGMWPCADWRWARMWPSHYGSLRALESGCAGRAVGGWGAHSLPASLRPRCGPCRPSLQQFHRGVLVPHSSQGRTVSLLSWSSAGT